MRSRPTYPGAVISVTGDEGALDPLAAVRADSVALDALGSGRSGYGPPDPAVSLLVALRAEIDAAVARGTTTDLRRDAALLDALAAGTPWPDGGEPAMALLHALRAGVDGAHVPAMVGAASPVRSSPRTSRRRRRVIRGGVAASSVALALSMSGVAAAAYDSHPGNAFYGLRTQTFGRTDDDPVAAEHVLAVLREQTAVAVRKPDDPLVVAKALASLSRFRHLVAAEHDTRAQLSITASASTVASSLAVLPVPAPLARHTASSRPSVSALSRRHPTLLAGSRAATASAVPAGPPSAGVTAEPAPRASSGDLRAGVGASPAATATPGPTRAPNPTGTPTPSDGGTVSVSPTTTVETPVGSASPSALPSTPAAVGASPAQSASAVATASSASASAARPVPTLRTTPAARVTAKAKPKPVRKHRVAATLLTAQLPSSGLPPR